MAKRNQNVLSHQTHTSKTRRSNERNRFIYFLSYRSFIHSFIYISMFDRRINFGRIISFCNEKASSNRLWLLRMLANCVSMIKFIDLLYALQKRICIWLNHNQLWQTIEANLLMIFSPFKWSSCLNIISIACALANVEFCTLHTLANTLPMRIRLVGAGIKNSMFNINEF